MTTFWLDLNQQHFTMSLFKLIFSLTGFICCDLNNLPLHNIEGILYQYKRNGINFPFLFLFEYLRSA